ncbi:hypothetical protein Nepgr_013641 [Nepenthes gracilis]|uniref:Uncharacterized protein n=1 Tax=Nepenthes gracilis TaxID=150966 RepID=A0AAD3SJ67_NEPGR|nr:hypothetical protein Nepgr_013641 [Nepenthes gracilis]
MAVGAIKAVVCDAVLTFMWMFCTSATGVVTCIIETAIGVGGSNWTYAILTVVFAVTIFVFNAIADALGASFNPAGNASTYAAGLPGDTLFSMALRFPAQAVGAVGGAMAINLVMPKRYRHMLVGPSLKVGMHTGAMAEGLLTFLNTFTILIISHRISAGSSAKAWLLAMATVTLVVAGSSYTGPSINPVNAFGWAYMENRHNTREHFYVYWICPLIGATLAALIFRVVFSQAQPERQKKAEKEE